MRGLTITIALLGLGFTTPASADERLPAGVQSIFEQRCLACHNDVDRKGDFSLQTAAGLKASAHVAPGNSDGSTLYQVLIATGGERPRMPPQGHPLTRDETERIRQWIAAGAAWPAETVLKEPVVNRFDWWSLQPLARPAIPRVAPRMTPGGEIRLMLSFSPGSGRRGSLRLPRPIGER